MQWLYVPVLCSYDRETPTGFGSLCEKCYLTSGIMFSIRVNERISTIDEI